MSALIPFILYLALLCFMILKARSLRLFSDEHLSRKHFTLFFLAKTLAIPVFYLVYERLYGGMEKFDTGKFFHDAAVIGNHGLKDPGFLLRLLLGLQNDSPGSEDFENVLQHTVNWDNGTVKDFLYNDNRIVIRLHALVHLLAFGSYFVHALFSCFLSFIGLLLIYKTFKSYFVSVEKWLFVVLCFIPSLWFYTGGLLKEGIVVFVLGCTLFLLKRTLERFSFLPLPALLVMLVLSCLLKPYLLVYSALFFGLFFYIEKHLTRDKLLIHLGTLLIFVISANIVSLSIKQRSLVSAALEHQRRFISVSRGGLFLENREHFLRLPPDTSLIKAVPSDTALYTIKAGAEFIYWKNTAPEDTIYCNSNTDTTTRYELVYLIEHSQSNIDTEPAWELTADGILRGLYYGFLYPFFVNAGSAGSLIASFENLLMLVFLMFSILAIGKKEKKFLPFSCLAFTLTFCLLLGIAVPNSGAIARYRAPASIFLLIGGLYLFSGNCKPGEKAGQ